MKADGHRERAEAALSFECGPPDVINVLDKLVGSDRGVTEAPLGVSLQPLPLCRGRGDGQVDAWIAADLLLLGNPSGTRDESTCCWTFQKIREGAFDREVPRSLVCPWLPPHPFNYARRTNVKPWI